MLLVIGKALFVTWSLLAGLWDLQCRRVPNWWMLCGYLLSGVLYYTAWQGGALGIEAAVIAISVSLLSILYWSFDWWGGADAKFLIVSVSVFPNPGFLAAQIVGQSMAAFSGQRGEKRSFPGVLVMSVSTLGYVMVSAVFAKLA
jgi:Flp pilus assembly protein protease CpaA